MTAEDPARLRSEAEIRRRSEVMASSRLELGAPRGGLGEPEGEELGLERVPLGEAGGDVGDVG